LHIACVNYQHIPGFLPLDRFDRKVQWNACFPIILDRLSSRFPHFTGAGDRLPNKMPEVLLCGWVMRCSG